jgi:hypothetical protein
MKVRILDKQTIAPIWVNKIGELLEKIPYWNNTYNIEIKDAGVRIRLVLHDDEFERIE